MLFGVLLNGGGNQPPTGAMMRSPTNRRRSNAAKQTVAVGVMIAAAIGFLMIIPRSSLFRQQGQMPSAEPDATRYIGEIRLAPAEDGRCRVIAFENRSGELWDKGLMPCDLDPSAPEQGGRLGSISRSFKGQ
jgi:hypothetical protein